MRNLYNICINMQNAYRASTINNVFSTINNVFGTINNVKYAINNVFSTTNNVFSFAYLCILLFHRLKSIRWTAFADSINSLITSNSDTGEGFKY